MKREREGRAGWLHPAAWTDSPPVSRPLLWLWLLLAAAAVGLDQFTKWLVVTYLRPVGDLPLWKGVLHLTYVENRGAAFGMLSGRRWIFMIFSWIAIAAVLFFLIWYRRYTTPLLGVALAMILGGGVGNMIDRAWQGYVVDFINVECIHFAVFNGADSFVCIGGALLVLWMLLNERKTRRRNSSDAEGAHGE